MSSEKTITIIGALAKVEASYAAGATFSNTTDGFELAEWSQVTVEYDDNGIRTNPPSSAGYIKKAAPSGGRGSGAMRTEIKGAGAAYSASVLPKGFHAMAQASGYTATITTTGGSEKVEYAVTNYPTVAWGSDALELYARGTKYPFSGVYADLEIGAEGPGFAYATFNWQGILGTIADANAPTITYITAVTPPKSAGSGIFTFGNFVNAKIRSWKFILGREVFARGNMSGAGLGAGRITPQLEVTIETTALTTTPFHAASAIDPFNLFSAATDAALQIAIGATQYNKYKLVSTSAQLMAPPAESEDGQVALTTLTFQLNDHLHRFD